MGYDGRNLKTYSPGKTAGKGATEGSWAFVVAAAVGLGVNAVLPDMEPETQAGIVAAVTGGVVAGVRAVRNWWKHRGT